MELRFGRTVQSAVLPPSWNPVRLRPVAPSRSGSEAAIVVDALERPLGGLSLDAFIELPRGNAGSPVRETPAPVVILVPDKTRLSRVDVILPLVLSRLERHVPEERIVILFANGTHGPQKREEMRSILGPGVLERYRVAEHDARAQGMVRLGTTPRGTEIEANPIAASASRIISIGAVVHHYFAGYGGGVKLLVPGICSYRTAVANHRRTLREDGSFHPSCRDGVIAGNPVYEDLVSALPLFPPVFSIMPVLDPHGEIAYCAAGDILEAHAKARAFADSVYAFPIRAAGDITIASAGGYPKDINLIQAHKALHRAATATRAGGLIIFLAECSDGLGNENFLDWFGYETDTAMSRAVLDRYSMNAHSAVSLRGKARRHTILFVTLLGDAAVTRMGLLPVPSFQAAVDRAQGLAPESPSVYLLENASLTVPVLESET